MKMNNEEYRKNERFKQLAYMNDEELEGLIDKVHARNPLLMREVVSDACYALREEMIDMIEGGEAAFQLAISN
jgi:hypothetical protein